MTLRRAVYRIHVTLGLVACGWLTVIGASGALLVFGREIEAMLSPELLRVESETLSASLDTIMDAVRERHPGETIYRIRFPQSANESLEVWLNSTTGLRVYVDPGDGRVLGTRDPQLSLMGWVRRIHVELLLGTFGRTFVGVCGIGLLTLCGSGLWMWWPGWRRLPQAFPMRWKASFQVRLYLWHRSLGAITAILLILSAGTGVALVFDHAAQFVVSVVSRLPPPTEPPQVVASSADSSTSLDSAVRLARAQLPSANVTWIWLPTRSNAVLAVRMRDPREWHPNGKSFVYLDSTSTEVLGVIDASQAADVSQITNQFYPLHIGGYLSPNTRVLSLASGIAVVALGITGIGSWWLRRRRYSAKRSPVRKPGQLKNGPLDG